MRDRKSLEGLAKGLTEGMMVYQLADPATYPRSGVMVEEHYAAYVTRRGARLLLPW